MKGPSKHALAQMKDAIRDGLRAIKNTLDDGKIKIKYMCSSFSVVFSFIKAKIGKAFRLYNI